jgi:hypothetical protein
MSGNSMHLTDFRNARGGHATQPPSDEHLIKNGLVKFKEMGPFSRPESINSALSLVKDATELVKKTPILVKIIIFLVKKTSPLVKEIIFLVKEMFFSVKKTPALVKRIFF